MTHIMRIDEMVETIDSTNEQIYVHEGFSAGYLDKTDGNSYCFDVYRTFSVEKFYKGDIAISIEELYSICPIEIDKINDILFNKGQKLVNVYQEIHNGKETGLEYWECGTPYKLDWTKISEDPAKDKNWYEKLTYRYKKEHFYNAWH